MYYVYYTSIKNLVSTFHLHFHAKWKTIDNQSLIPKTSRNNRQKTGKSEKHIPKISVLIFFQTTPKPSKTMIPSTHLPANKIHTNKLAIARIPPTQHAKVNAIDNQPLIYQNT